MSLVALDGTPLVPIGSAWNIGQSSAFGTTNVTMDAANEAAIEYGQIVTDDGASHTIDTSGSSSLQWRTSAVTFANAGTTVVVGLATMDLATGPVGRATNAADVITMSVSKSLTGGGGGITANTWHTHVPDTGSLAVANADFIAFCTQMTARGNVDSVQTSTSTTGVIGGRPSVTGYTGGSYAGVASVPNCLIVFSDGHLGWFAGSTIFANSAATTWNSGSPTVEYGNFLKFPFPVKIYGIYSMFALAADCDFVLYSDPLGTPVPEKTVSADANATGAATVRAHYHLFTSPYTAAANQPLAAIAKPGGSNVTMTSRQLNDASHQATDHCGTNGYAISRASGAFAALNSSKDRYPIGFLVGAFGARNEPINARDLVR